MVRSAIPAALLTLSLSGPARALLINNGSAPPDPANVVAGVSENEVVVRNAGCGVPDPNGACPSPGAPTAVELQSSPLIGTVRVYDSSSADVNGARPFRFFTFGSASLTVSDGDFFFGGTLNGSSSVVVQGGSAGIQDPNGRIRVNDTAHFSLTSGWVGPVTSQPGTTVTVSGGRVGVGPDNSFLEGALEVTGGGLLHAAPIERQRVAQRRPGFQHHLRQCRLFRGDDGHQRELPGSQRWCRPVRGRGRGAHPRQRRDGRDRGRRGR